MTFIETLRTPRFFGMAVFDWTFSLVAAYLLGHYILKLKNPPQWTAFIVFWIIFGILAHVITNTPTMMNYYLGLSKKPSGGESSP